MHIGATSVFLAKMRGEVKRGWKTAPVRVSVCVTFPGVCTGGSLRSYLGLRLLRRHDAGDVSLLAKPYVWHTDNAAGVHVRFGIDFHGRVSVPMAKVLFAAHTVGVMLLPLMIFHQIQLMVCAVLAQRYAKRAP